MWGVGWGGGRCGVVCVGDGRLVVLGVWGVCVGCEGECGLVVMQGCPLRLPPAPTRAPTRAPALSIRRVRRSDAKSTGAFRLLLSAPIPLA